MACLVSLHFLLTLILWVSGTVSTNQNVDSEPAYIQDRVRSLLCMPKNVSDAAGKVASHYDVENVPYGDGMDCTFTINTKPGQHINIRFEFFDVAPSYDSREKKCRPGGDLLSIYESSNIFLIKTNILEPEVKLCGGTGDFPADYLSVSNVVTVRFNTNEYPTDDKGVRFTYTSFINPQERTPDCFMCKDGTMCISQAMTCDGMPNCNDDSDEDDSLCRHSQSANIFQKGIDELGVGVMSAIAAAVGLLLLCLVVLCVVCCCCCMRRKKDADGKGQYRAPPTPRPGSYPSHNSNYSSYSSSASNTATRPYPNFPPGYPPFHNGGYSVAYNYENGRMEFPHKV